MWTNRYTEILRNCFNSYSTILPYDFFHCFSVFISCWRTKTSRVDVIFCTTCKHFSLIIADSPNANANIWRALEHLSLLCIEKFKTNSLIHFFRKQDTITHTNTHICLIVISVKNSNNVNICGQHMWQNKKKEKTSNNIKVGQGPMTPGYDHYIPYINSLNKLFALFDNNV